MKKWCIFLLVGFIFCEALCFAFSVRYFLYPTKYKDAVISYSQKYDISPYLIFSVIKAESNFNKNAKSSAGAIGLMQIVPSTASYVAHIFNIPFSNADELYEPQKNIELGSAYLKYLSTKFSTTDTILSAYNAGETITRSWLNDTNYSLDKITLYNIPYKETKNYIKKINKNIKIYKKYKY